MPKTTVNQSDQDSPIVKIAIPATVENIAYPIRSSFPLKEMDFVFNENIGILQISNQDNATDRRGINQILANRGSSWGA